MTRCYRALFALACWALVTWFRGSRYHVPPHYVWFCLAGLAFGVLTGFYLRGALFEEPSQREQRFQEWGRRLPARAMAALRLVLTAVTVTIIALWSAPAASAAPEPVPFPCPYPAVGIGIPNILGAYGGFCDYPTEINGSHMHCESGGFELGDLFGGTSIGTGSLIPLPIIGGIGSGVGAGGGGCTWRYPDNTLALAPNPPGAWRNYLIPLKVPDGHSKPAGPWSETVHMDQGYPTDKPPPVNQTPADTKPVPTNPEQPQNPSSDNGVPNS